MNYVTKLNSPLLRLHLVLSMDSPPDSMIFDAFYDVGKQLKECCMYLRKNIQNLEVNTLQIMTKHVESLHERLSKVSNTLATRLANKWYHLYILELCVILESVYYELKRRVELLV